MKNKLTVVFAVCTVIIFLLASCKKDEAIGATETYKIVGRNDPARTTIPGVSVRADFTLSINSRDSFGVAQSVLNGDFSVTGYTGIAVQTLTSGSGSSATTTYNADTLSLFATQANGPVISYITVPATVTLPSTPAPSPTSVFSTTRYTTKFYNYNNTSNASFRITNFPFTNDITQPLKEGRGYFRMGKSPNYVYILLDNVTKL